MGLRARYHSRQLQDQPSRIVDVLEAVRPKMGAAVPPESQEDSINAHRQVLIFFDVKPLLANYWTIKIPIFSVVKFHKHFHDYVKLSVTHSATGIFM